MGSCPHCGNPLRVIAGSITRTAANQGEPGRTYPAAAGESPALDRATAIRIMEADEASAVDEWNEWARRELTGENPEGR